MKRTTFLAVALGLILTATAAWGDTTPVNVTYYGGFEDSTAGSDWDYNDLVFSLTGVTLNTKSGGQWNNKPSLSTIGSPFWNHRSSDYPNEGMNIGYCVYGGGNCGAGLDSRALYLATSGGGAVTDVTFSAAGTVSGTVSAKLFYHIADNQDRLTWRSVNNPNSWGYINFDRNTGSFSFSPGGDFYLRSENLRSNSGNGVGSNLPSSNFAWFRSGDPTPSPTPEPGTLALLGSGLISVAGVVRRKLNR